MPAKTIEILGTGCSKCKALEASARKAVADLGIDAEVLKIDRINDIIARGVVMTPTIVVDGVVKSSGRALSPEEVKKLLA